MHTTMNNAEAIKIGYERRWSWRASGLCLLKYFGRIVHFQFKQKGKDYSYNNLQVAKIIACFRSPRIFTGKNLSSFVKRIIHCGRHCGVENFWSEDFNQRATHTCLNSQWKHNIFVSCVSFDIFMTPFLH